MTEEEAQDWLRNTFNVSRETMGRLDAYRQMVIAGNADQNLISASTFDSFWVRHIVDSAQLLTLVQPVDPSVSSAVETGSASLDFAREERGGRGVPKIDQVETWLDLGSGAGLPGIVIALLRDTPIHLVESRKGRAAFLESVVDALGLTHCTVHGCKLEQLRLPPVSVITARAFSPLPKLLGLAHSFSTQKTRWLLPKGRSARTEVESVCGTWQGVFHVEQSITDPDAAIIVASGIRKAGRR